MELRLKDLENGSDWYVWRYYVDFVPTLVQGHLSDKFDEKEAVVFKGKLIEKLYSSWGLGRFQVSVHFFTSFRLFAKD